MDLVHRIPTEIPEEVVKWFSYPGVTLSLSAQTFIRHLMAFREAINDDAVSDGAIILEENIEVAPDFDDRFDPILEDLPGDTQILLLSHYVTDWSKVTPYVITDIDNQEDENLVGTPNGDVHGSFAYWISRSWMERCLHLYDRPLRTLMIDVESLSPALLTRTPTTLMVFQPLAYRKDTPEYTKYFEFYGY